MTEVSARLRAARERAGLTIREISASTKIRTAALEAIERGEFASLPGEFYTRAFLRTYASHLGLSPQAIVADYESERPQAQPQERVVAPGEVRRSSPGHGWQVSISRAVSHVMSAAASTGVVLAVVVGLLVVAAVKDRPQAARTAESGAVGTSGSGTVLPAPAPAASAAPAAPAPEGLTIEIQAAAPLWVTAAADGKRVLYRLLAPGERVTVKARDNFAFRVGDASAFTYSVNGTPGKTLGAAGEVRDVEITRANYRSFAR